MYDLVIRYQQQRCLPIHKGPNQTISYLLQTTPFSQKEKNPLMASSSKTYEGFDQLKHKEEEELAEEPIERDWLELGLGFGPVCRKPVKNRLTLASASTSSSLTITTTTFTPPLPSHQTQKQSGLELGLGFENESPIKSEGVVALSLPPARNRGYHNLPSSSLTLITSQSWPVQSSASNTHHYYGRPQPGLWFTLHSSINRNGEELPQLPKTYIRVKDENMTVLMVKMYLVRKLGLSNEAEVEISCMGQELSEWLTLRHVRDDIWLPRLIESVNSRSAAASTQSSHEMLVNHLMSLHYGRGS